MKKIFSDLENLVEEFTSKYGVKTKKLTVREVAERKLLNIRKYSLFAVERERAQLKETEDKNQKMQTKVSIAETVMMRGGYVRISQHLAAEYEIQSGFTGWEEVVELVESNKVWVSEEELQATFGTIVYRVEENGIMNMISHKIDSGD